jgi:transcriptional regulator with XRE-family HTH domain
METKKIHIGELIESVCKSENVNLSELARRIGTTRQNVRSIIKRDTVDVKLLFTISEALKYDFFRAFRISNEIELQKTKVILNIEIEDDKKNDVLRYIQDKQLYNILTTK